MIETNKHHKRKPDSHGDFSSEKYSFHLESFGSTITRGKKKASLTAQTFFVHKQLLVSNILSSPAGNATSACVFISHFKEAKREVDSVDWRVYYTFSLATGVKNCISS